MGSILDDIKKLLGIQLDETSFDVELLIHINGAISVLTQLGIGPAIGYTIISKDDTWIPLIGDRKDLEMVKLAIYYRVRLQFDPPQNSFLLKSFEERLNETEWRLSIAPTQ